MFRTFATAAILALTIGTAQASPPPAIVIPIGDLNLSNPADVRVLAGRAETAAQDACSDWKPSKWEKLTFYKKLYDSCVDTTSHRVISRAFDKSASRVAHLARN
jgi:UrcA family protein